MAEAEKAPEIVKSPADYLKEIYDKFKEVSDKGGKDRAKADPSKELVVLKEDEKGPFESPKSIWGMNFDLSKYYVEDTSKQPQIAENAVYFLNGSVDRTSFRKHGKRENIVVITTKEADGSETKVKWYEDAKNMAVLFLRYADRIETDGFSTMEAGAKRDRMMEIMKAMSETTDFTDEAWNKMIKDNGYTDAEVFGPEGAYNLLLAFSRATGNISMGEDNKVVVGKDKDGNDIEVPVYYKINLSLAKKAGRHRKDRYGKVVELKVKEEEEEEKPKKELKVELKEEPKKELKVELKEEPKKEPKDEPKPEPIKPKEDPKRIEAQEKLGNMLAALSKEGFELTWTPSEFGQSVYVKYGDKRLNVAVNEDGSYSYQLLSRPQSRDNTDGGVKGKGTIAEMRKAIDSEPVDKEKVMTLDLQAVSINTKRGSIIESVKVTSLTPRKDKGTYDLVIHADNYEMGGKVYEPFDLKLIVEYQGGVVYRGDIVDGSPVGVDKDATKFIQKAIKIGSAGLLKDGKLKEK